MDSYSFQFERMSNVDLHPLSLPVSRLSPAKSSSSIADQFAHHQHGKGDSAYSSFSGGSTAQDYPSPFLPDDLQSNSFSHYADLKYVKSIYHPAQAAQTDTRAMDQLYRSVEAISQQYRNHSAIKANHVNNNSNATLHTNNNNTVSKQEVPHAHSACPNILRPPPIPARMDSFIATKNLENTRAQRHSAEFHPQQPHQQPRSHCQPQAQAYGLNSPRPVRVMSDTGNLSPHSELVYSVWRGSQQQLPQVQKQSNHTRITSNPEYLYIADNRALSERRNSANTLRQTPSQSVSPPQELRKPSGSGASKGGNHKYNGGDKQSESQRKRAYSANDWLGAETPRASSPWTAGIINSSIQHKGHFYFVTGVCRKQSASSCGSDAGSKSSPEKYQLREKERCHSTAENLFRPLQQSSRSSSGTIQDEVFASVFQDQDLPSWNQDQENRRLSSHSIQSTQSLDAFEEINSENREIGRHTSGNPIFYCGPDRTCPPQSTLETAGPAFHVVSEQTSEHKKAEQAKKGVRQPLGDIGSERINKETTPLLYHLTGASRAALQPRKEPSFSTKNKELNQNETTYDVSAADDERPPKTDTDKNISGDLSACNTLDDSFKKYYKEKLKDAQSKVLRATSFKRKDLQLSWSHRIRAKPEMTPPVVHTFSSSQDSQTSTETLTPSLSSEETETGSTREDVREDLEMEREAEEANRCPVNVAQPQVVRIGGKKRLTPEERKKCYSEPEKLNQLGSAPFHSSCRSFGNESENAFAVEDEEPNCEQQGEPGLVAARRKMFETKGQDFSVPAALKPSLKHLQQKALAEYMERKTGHRVPEQQQQPGILVPPSSRHRHSLGEKPFDWGPKLPPGNQDGKNSKKKLHRPHSAGRVLDSPTTSVRYAQFFSAQSCSGQYGLQANQPRWSKGPSQGKCASAESLLDQLEPPGLLRNRSASTPHTLEDLQDCDNEEDSRPVKLVEATSLQKMSTEDSLKKAVAEGRRRARVVAQRGKSMEELGTSKITRLPAISKSSEQLDRLRSLNVPVGFDGEQRGVSVFAESGQVQGQERDAKAENVPQQAAEEPESVLITQGPTPHQTQRKSPFKQHPEPGEDPAAPTGDSSGSTSPASPSASGIGLLPGSHGPASDTFTSSRPPSETLSNPPSPRGLEDSGCGGRSFPPSPTQTKPACESRCPTRSEREESVDDPNGDSGQDVLLTCGVTTDPSLWNLPPEESSQTTESLFHHETAPLTPPDTHAGEASVPDRDASEPAQDEKNPEGGDEEPEERQETEERGTSEGEAKAQRPMDRLQWEELVEAVVAAEPSLARVMYPLANRKTALMLMEQLLSEDTLLMEEHYKKKQELQGATDSSENAEVAEKAPPAPDKPTPACPTLQNKADVAEKKRLLASHIEEHLRSLEEMRGPLQAEVDVNAAHGAALELLVQERCLPLELERYSLFIGDLERVVNLLLCLSARLARVQNALSTVDQHTDAEEKQSLDSRHRLLCKQREDAKDLKDNLDRRENVVSTFLSRQLSAEQLQDYRRFVQTKASLLIRQKDLEEKQRLGEEQLEALSSSLNL